MAHWQRLSTIDQFTAFLRAELLSGKWVNTMPGAHWLTAEFGINRKTVDAALQALENEGLLVGQGVGRKRKIVLPENYAAPVLRVAILDYDVMSQGLDYMLKLCLQLEEAGHTYFYTDKTLEDLGMNTRRLARYVKNIKTDAWIVCAGSQDILEWFAGQETPAFALFGRMAGLPLAGMKPDKTLPLREATRYLLGHGHSRISFLTHRELRLPQPGRSIRAFLAELEAAGIATGSYNMPDWDESPEGFVRLLDSLFDGPTPPTALILCEPILYHAAFHHLSQQGLRVPLDVSLICTDYDPYFTWCLPTVSHIRWDHNPLVRRVVRWTNNIAKGKDDRRQSFPKAKFVEGGTIGPAPE
jgi:DNA-binding LacI/PurR family transcriptional regulator